MEQPIVQRPLHKHLHEWPFWCLLATRTAGTAEETLPQVLADVTAHAGRLGVPAAFDNAKGRLWAHICRLYVMARMNAKDSGKLGYAHQIFGIGRAFGSPRFTKIAFSKIKKQVLAPAFEDRTFRGSVADAFLANGASSTVSGLLPAPLEKNIAAVCFPDAAMADAASRTITPPPELWDETVTQYYQRRAGYLRTMFSSARNWRTDLSEVMEGEKKP